MVESFELNESGGLEPVYPAGSEPASAPAAEPQYEAPPTIDADQAQAVLEALQERERELAERDSELETLRRQLQEHAAQPRPLTVEELRLRDNYPELAPMWERLSALEEERQERATKAANEQVADRLREEFAIFDSLHQQNGNPGVNEEAFWPWVENHPIYGAAVSFAQDNPQKLAVAMGHAYVEYAREHGLIAPPANGMPYVPPGAERSGPRARMVIPVAPGWTPEPEQRSARATAAERLAMMRALPEGVTIVGGG